MLIFLSDDVLNIELYEQVPQSRLPSHCLHVMLFVLIEPFIKWVIGLMTKLSQNTRCMAL